ncbi:unnamed protein product [Diabrotica balteata]|uniref:acid phosphatase n=1 Tax=Diabrotica balteata TaxID=107213 RepID=A0A9N9SWP0_DIABA|nr:unnamed protein product [Diabrotica balteata]
MALIYFIFLGLACLGAKGEEDKLNGVVVIYRHGDRTPVDPYPNDPYKNRSYWPIGFGQLTNKGKQQHFQLGQWFRDRYDGFLPRNYFVDDIYVMSSDYDRTLMSAEANLAGLYPPVKTQTWEPKLKWQPIPVHSSPRNQDALVAGQKPCAKYDLLLKQLYKTPYFRNMSHSNHDLFAYLTRYTGHVVADLKEVQYLYSNLYIESLFNYTLPPWTSKVFPGKLKSLASVGFAVETWTPEMARFKTGPLFNYITSYFKNRTSKNPTSTKFVVFSAHDTNIANVLNSMGAFDPHCPPYTSTILFELWRNARGEDYVNILYKNTTEPRPIALKNCRLNCSLSDFVEILKPITITLDQWEKECVVRWDFVWPLTFQWNIILICSLITVILLLSAVIVGVRKSRKECDNNYIQLPNEEYA